MNTRFHSGGGLVVCGVVVFKGVCAIRDGSSSARRVLSCSETRGCTVVATSCVTCSFSATVSTARIVL